MAPRVLQRAQGYVVAHPVMLADSLSDPEVYRERATATLLVTFGVPPCTWRSRPFRLRLLRDTRRARDGQRTQGLRPRNTPSNHGCSCNPKADRDGMTQIVFVTLGVPAMNVEIQAVRDARRALRWTSGSRLRRIPSCSRKFLGIPRLTESVC